MLKRLLLMQCVPMRSSASQAVKNKSKNQINHLLKLDRVVFVVVIACGIISVCIGVTTFKCLFSGIEYTLETCETEPYENAFYLYFRVSVALDIITDALSKCASFPDTTTQSNLMHASLEFCPLFHMSCMCSFSLSPRVCLSAPLTLSMAIRAKYHLSRGLS